MPLFQVFLIIFEFLVAPASFAQNGDERRWHERSLIMWTMAHFTCFAQEQALRPHLLAPAILTSYLLRLTSACEEEGLHPRKGRS